MATDLPVDPCPAGLYDDRKELWYCCAGIVNHHETGDDLKQLALVIRQQLRLEARVNELTELFYSVKAERDKLRHLLREVAEIAERFHQTTSSRYRPVEWLEAEARWLAIRDTVMGKEGDRAE